MMREWRQESIDEARHKAAMSHTFSDENDIPSSLD
tara:strand:+ start:2486 stop:2590 length:105 start_codon:yes stop_codon:yes gene_type:complete